MSSPSKVDLRSEQRGDDSFFLWAYLDADGNLHIDGQDLGPVTAVVSSDGEYEYFQTVAAADVIRLLRLLGEPEDADVLQVLRQKWSGVASWEFDRVLRESDIPVKRFVYGG
jgi:hypothetical protein